ncbi:MAG: hypothetical protein M3O41_09370 [Pseudomonadota bacterium]|nr:hypothetical protein [Pseudomonadota bacterium]
MDEVIADLRAEIGQLSSQVAICRSQLRDAERKVNSLTAQLEEAKSIAHDAHSLAEQAVAAHQPAATPVVIDAISSE